MENGNQFRNRRPYAASEPWDQGAHSNYRRREDDSISGNRADYNRINYIPDNDANRAYRDRDYEDNNYGSSGTYGSHGAYSSDYGYQGQGNADRYGNTSYGKQYYEERDRNRNQDFRQSSNRYGDDYRRRDYGRSMLGNNYGTAGTGYQNQGYGSSADGYRSDYAGNGNNYISGSVHYGYPQNDRSSDDRDWWDRTRDKVASWLGDDDAKRRSRMDERQEGAHRGKGPKGYQRSEDRIREDVCDRLADDAMLDASDINVEIHGNEVVLSGNVHSKAERRRAEDLVESISGVRHVENRLRIMQDSNTGTGTWRHGRDL